MKTADDEFGLVLRPKLSLAQRAERAMLLFGPGHVLPATSARLGHGRTSFFYRQAAIDFARSHRQQLFPGSDVCLRLAKAYLASYRRMKGVAR